jgi:hypothetical protein
MTPGIIYEIEGGVDFFKELKQFGSATQPATTPSSSSSSTDEAEVRCLITHEKLRKDHIALTCGHRFNYVPLFKEVLFQKCSLLPKNLSSKIITTYTKPTITTSLSPAAAAAAVNTPLPTNTNKQSNVTSILHNSSYNLETTKLNYNQIKCPYCRTITHYLLPYYPYPDVCKVKYVNFPPNLSLPSVSCEYDKFVSGTTTEMETIDAGLELELDLELDTSTCRSLCTYNEKYDLILCNKHLNKLEASASSSAASSKKKGGKKKPRTQISINDENVIISHHNPATAKCSFILLSGPRKGCPCEKPHWVPKLDTLNNTHAAAYCKAHYDKGFSTSS